MSKEEGKLQIIPGITFGSPCICVYIHPHTCVLTNMQSAYRHTCVLTNMQSAYRHITHTHENVKQETMSHFSTFWSHSFCLYNILFCAQFLFCKTSVGACSTFYPDVLCTQENFIYARTVLRTPSLLI